MYVKPLTAAAHGFLRTDTHQMAFDGRLKRGRVTAFTRKNSIELFHQSRIAAAVTVSPLYKIAYAYVFSVFSENPQFDHISLLV